MSTPDLACPATGCFICLQVYDVFALTAFALVCWFLLIQRTDSPSPPPPATAKTADLTYSSTRESPNKTANNVRQETHTRFTSLTVPRRPRRVKKLIRADLDLKFSDPESDSEEGLQSIDYSSNFLSLNERDLAKSLADFRQIQSRLNRANSNSSDCSGISSSSNNPSVMNSDHNSCDSLRDADDQSHQSFLSDTLRNRYHILYEVFNSQPAMEFNSTDPETEKPSAKLDCLNAWTSETSL